jgi:hypothetical protein
VQTPRSYGEDSRKGVQVAVMFRAKFDVLAPSPQAPPVISVGYQSKRSHALAFRTLGTCADDGSGTHETGRPVHRMRGAMPTVVLE